MGALDLRVDGVVELDVGGGHLRFWEHGLDGLLGYPLWVEGIEVLDAGDAGVVVREEWADGGVHGGCFFLGGEQCKERWGRDGGIVFMGGICLWVVVAGATGVGGVRRGDTVTSDRRQVLQLSVTPGQHSKSRRACSVAVRPDRQEQLPRASLRPCSRQSEAAGQHPAADPHAAADVSAHERDQLA